MIALNKLKVPLCVLCLAALAAAGCSKPSAEELFQEGAQLLGQKNFVAARNRFEEILENYPKHEIAPLAHFQIGDCFHLEERPDDAEAAYKEILSSYPNTEPASLALVRLADTALRDKQFDVAEEYFKQAIEGTTNTVRIAATKDRLAYCYLSSNKPDQAIQTLREIIDLSAKPIERIQTADKICQILFRENRADESWEMIRSTYEPDFPPRDMEYYLNLIMTMGQAFSKHDEGAAFYDTIISNTTDEEKLAQALYFKGILASSTDSTVIDGINILKEANATYPKTDKGMWAPVIAASIVMAVSDQFANPIEEASALFSTSIAGYREVVSDLTTEWFEPDKALVGWFTLAGIYESRGHTLQNVDDLISASETLAQIPKRFSTQKRAVQSAGAKHADLVGQVRMVGASPEMFWDKIREIRRGVPPGPPELGVEGAAAGSQSAPVAIPQPNTPPNAAAVQEKEIGSIKDDLPE